MEKKSLNIGIVINRIGGLDGVSLETEKWIAVLEKLGHKIFILTGKAEKPFPNTTICPILSFFSPECEWEQKRAFFYPDKSPEELLTALERNSNFISGKIFSFVATSNIDLLITQNNLALPCHLSAGMGLKKALKVLNIPCITHDHDFYWERGDRYKTPFKEIKQIIKETFPLDLPNIKHAVINTPAKNYLKENLNINAVLVPNVMDFNEEFGQEDIYSKKLREVLKLSKDDILLFQATRVVKRKGIEVAIELVHKLEIENVKLVITGTTIDDEENEYTDSLNAKIKKYGIEDQVIFAEHFFKRERSEDIFSLSDAYANAAACTYFSTYEGFGNAFVECVLAKKPIFVNNYEPVYWSDIGSKGFKTVQLENNELTDEAVDKIKKILLNKELQKEIADYNFELGKKHFSFQVLEEKILELFDLFE